MERFKRGFQCQADVSRLKPNDRLLATADFPSARALALRTASYPMLHSCNASVNCKTRKEGDKRWTTKRYLQWALLKTGCCGVAGAV